MLKFIYLCDALMGKSKDSCKFAPCYEEVIDCINDNKCGHGILQ